MVEAALITAQQSSRDLTYMRLNMEETMQRTALAQTFAIEKVHELCSLVQKNAFVYAVDLEGNGLDTLIDVDFWTSGGLTNLYNRCEGLLKQLEEDHHGSGIEEYERMLNSSFRSSNIRWAT
jgi:hypothetical protein